MSTDTLRVKRDALANKFYSEIKIDETEANKVMLELMFGLASNDFTLTSSFTDYHDLIQSITCLLINPDISNKLNIYLQENAGEMLQQLLHFFNSLNTNTNLRSFLLYKILKSYPEDLENDILNDIKVIIYKLSKQE